MYHVFLFERLYIGSDQCICLTVNNAEIHSIFRQIWRVMQTMCFMLSCKLFLLV